MKKLLFTAGTVAVLALASCSNDEIDSLTPSNSDQIRYSVVMSNSTRANSYFDASSQSLKDMPNFVVYARMHTDAEDGATYIDGDDVTYNSGSGSYVYNQRYWPDASSSLDFLAYTGKLNTFGTSTSQKATYYNGALNVLNVSLNPDVSKQDDMLYALAEQQNGKDADGVAQDVQLNFRHAFAQLNFAFKCSNPNLNVIVDEVRLVNIDTKGNVKFASTDELNNTSQNFEGVANDAKTDDQKMNIDDYTLCTWSNVGNFNKKDASGKFTYSTPTGESGSRKNWAYLERKSNPITLTSTAQQLDPTPVRDASSFLTKAASSLTTGAALSEDYGYKEATGFDCKVTLYTLGGANSQFNTDCAAIESGLTKEQFEEQCKPVAPDIADYPGAESDDATDLNATMARAQYANAWNTYVGQCIQFAADDAATEDGESSVYAEALKAFTAAYSADLMTAKRLQAAYVIPQAVTPGDIPATAKHLTDVTGMYFLIKCAIQNVADGKAAKDSDAWLFGDANTTKFILVPLRASDYNEATQEEEADKFISSWKAGRKYIYTFIFGEQGSNAGIPIIDPEDDPEPEDPDIDPDPEDPDNPSPIDPNQPTLRLITYSVSSISIDDFQKGGNNNVDVNSKEGDISGE